jgi:hypothetical protein
MAEAKVKVKGPDRKKFKVKQFETFQILGEAFSDNAEVTLEDRTGHHAWTPSTITVSHPSAGGTALQVSSTPTLMGPPPSADGDLTITVTNQGGETSGPISTTVDYTT